MFMNILMEQRKDDSNILYITFLAELIYKKQIKKNQFIFR